MVYRRSSPWSGGGRGDPGRVRDAALCASAESMSSCAGNPILLASWPSSKHGSWPSAEHPGRRRGPGGSRFGPPGGVYLKDRLLLRTPVFGRHRASRYLNRFCRTLSVVLKAGCPLGQTFDAVVTGTGTWSNERAFQTVRDR